MGHVFDLMQGFYLALVELVFENLAELIHLGLLCLFNLVDIPLSPILDEIR
jgi:hypothetical protein